MADNITCRSFFLAEQGSSVEGNVLKDVVLLGPTSTNGNEYTLDAMRSAVPFYQGRGVYVDHDLRSKGRKASERFGHVIPDSVRVVESDHDGRPRVRGSVRFLPTHPLAPSVVAAYTDGLPYFGMSHVADGVGRVEGKKRFVEQITSVSSLDLVDKAATGTLVEQAEPDADDSQYGMDPQQMGKEALAQMISAIILDDAMTPEMKKKKIDAMIDAHHTGDGQGPAAEPGAAASPAPPPMSEQSLLAKIGTLVEQQFAKLAEQVRPREFKYLKPGGTDAEAPKAPPADAPKDANGRKRFLTTP